MKRRGKPALGAWAPSLQYVEWVDAAGRYPDQNAVWRFHKLFARQNYAEQRDYDLGGEA